MIMYFEKYCEVLTFLYFLMCSKMGWEPKIGIFVSSDEEFEKAYIKNTGRNPHPDITGFTHPSPRVIKEALGLDYKKKSIFEVRLKDRIEPMFVTPIFIHELLHIFYPDKCEREVKNFEWAICFGILKKPLLRKVLKNLWKLSDVGNEKNEGFRNCVQS